MNWFKNIYAQSGLESQDYELPSRLLSTLHRTFPNIKETWLFRANGKSERVF